MVVLPHCACRPATDKRAEETERLAIEPALAWQWSSGALAQVLCSWSPHEALHHCYELYGLDRLRKMQLESGMDGFEAVFYTGVGRERDRRNGRMAEG